MSSVSARRLLLIPLGDTASIAHRLAREQFGSVSLFVLDRAELRRAPVRTLRGLLVRGFDDVLLVAPRLDQPRVKLTALLAALPRARRRWVGDGAGRVRSFSTRAHLVAHLLPMARHLAAVGCALVLTKPLLQVALMMLRREERTGARRVAGRRPARLLYLRGQFWFDLKGGGSVAHTSGVIGGLQQAGVEVRVVSTDRLEGVAAPTWIVKPERWFDGVLKEAEELAFNVAFLRAARLAASIFRPDAIYQRYTVFNFGGALLSRLLRVPFVLEFNSSDVWKGKHWGEFHLLRLAALAERVNLAAADRIVVVSDALEQSLMAEGLPPTRILVNPNGVDPDRFHPDVDGTAVRARHGLGPRIVIGFSGTFGVWHGIPTLAEALPLVCQQRPDAVFLLVGDGGLRPLIDEAVARHGLQERVVPPGLVPHHEMPAYLAACDLLVAPHGRQADGRTFFGSPTKLFEYMAAGRAIVASSVGQIGDVLEHERTALLVPPEDARALAAAIVRLLDDEPLRRRLGEAARQQAVQQHTWRRNAERVLDAVGAPR